jgi:hypothetical protein
MDLKQVKGNKKEPPRFSTAKNQKNIIKPAVDIFEEVPPIVNR